jgi:hypothetical protein
MMGRLGAIDKADPGTRGFEMMMVDASLPHPALHPEMRQGTAVIARYDCPSRRWRQNRNPAR